MNVRIGLFTKPEGVPYLEADWIDHESVLDGMEAVEEAAGLIPAGWIVLVQSGRAFTLAWDGLRPLDGPIFDSRDNDA